MRLLLDTHVFLWWLQDSPRLGPEARRRIANPKSLVHVSAATIWELSIKSALGKLHVEKADFPAEIAANGFVELPVTAAHAWQAGRLPGHHDDPFDRMLVAQAEIEELTVLTHDSALGRYGISVLPA